MKKNPKLHYLNMILSFISTAIFILLLAASLFIFFLPRIGFPLYAVTSGSMEPAIPVGSLIIAEKTDPQTVQSGDIIIFQKQNSTVPITHRVVENITSANHFITKGDANPSNDITPAEYSQLIGKVLFILPGIGSILYYFSSNSGRFILILLFLAAAILFAVSDKLKKAD